MAGAIGSGGFVNSDAIHLVERAGEKLPDQARRRRRVVCAVAVDQHINVGFHIGEHSADDVPFALAALGSYDGAGLARDVRGAVSRIVVIDINSGLRQARAKAPHDTGDGQGFIVAGHENRDRDRVRAISGRHWVCSRRNLQILIRLRFP